jgi:hypothetical protein
MLRRPNAIVTRSNDSSSNGRRRTVSLDPADHGVATGGLAHRDGKHLVREVEADNARTWRGAAQLDRHVTRPARDVEDALGGETPRGNPGCMRTPELVHVQTQQVIQEVIAGRDAAEHGPHQPRLFVFYGGTAQGNRRAKLDCQRGTAREWEHALRQRVRGTTASCDQIERIIPS